MAKNIEKEALEIAKNGTKSELENYLNLCLSSGLISETKYYSIISKCVPYLELLERKENEFNRS